MVSSRYHAVREHYVTWIPISCGDLYAWPRWSLECRNLILCFVNLNLMLPLLTYLFTYILILLEDFLTLIELELHVIYGHVLRSIISYSNMICCGYPYSILLLCNVWVTQASVKTYLSCDGYLRCLMWNPVGTHAWGINAHLSQVIFVSSFKLVWWWRTTLLMQSIGFHLWLHFCGDFSSLLVRLRYCLSIQKLVLLR